MTSPRSTALAPIRAVDAGAVVGDLDDDLAALVPGAQGEHALGRLADPHAGVGVLDAVVDGVADQVRQRVLDRLEQGLVQLGVAALHLQADGLLQLEAQVADDARQLGPDVVDRLHARLHDALLQLAGDEVEPLRGAHQVGVVGAPDVLDDLVAGEHQLPHQQHQLVEQVDVHPDGAVGDRPAGLAGAALGGGDGVALVRGLRLEGGLDDRRGPRGRDGRGLGHGRRRLDGRLGGSGLRGGLRGGLGNDLGDGVGRSLDGGLRLDGRRGGVLHGRADGRDHGGDVDRALPTGGLDGAEQRPDGVHHLQQHAGALRGQLQRAVPQSGEHVLPDVGDLLEAVERQEAAGPLDGVDRAEDAREALARVGLLLEGDQVGVQLVEVLVTLDQELLDDVVQTVHVALLSSNQERCVRSGW